MENDGSAALTNCILTGNVAASDGGGVDNTGTLVLTNSTFSTNTAAYGAGVANKSAPAPRWPPTPASAEQHG